MERCSPTDAKPDIALRKEKEVPQERPENCIRHHYEEPAVECGTHRNGFNPVATRPKEAMLNGASTWDNGREESPAQP